MHFGVLLGWSVLQSMVLWFMVNQIASNEVAEARALDLYSCCCIVGYGMVPLLLLSVAVLLVPRCVYCGVCLCVGCCCVNEGRAACACGSSHGMHTGKAEEVTATTM